MVQNSSTMKTVEDLIGAAVGELTKLELGKATGFSAPANPAMVLYFGDPDNKRIGMLKADMDRGLAAGWGEGKADLVPQIALTQAVESSSDDDSDSDLNFVNLKTGSVMSNTDFSTALTAMSNRNVVKNAGRYNLYCVLDSKGMDVDAFKAWYLSLPSVLKLLSGASVSAMLLIALDQTPGTGNGRAITTALSELYSDPEVSGADQHLYQGVFCFSNYDVNNFSTGLLDDADEGLEQCDVFADTVLMTDTYTRDDTLDRIRFSLNDPAHAGITAAYSRVSKPLHDIVLVLVQSILNRVSEATSHDSPITDTEIRNAFNSAEGEPSILDEYESQIRAVEQNFAGFEQYLPSTNPDIVVADIPYRNADELSGGVLSAFIAQNHMVRLRGEAGSNGATATLIGDRLRNLFSATRWATNDVHALQESVADALSSLGGGYSASDALPVRQAVHAKLKEQALEGVKRDVPSLVHDLYEQAQVTVKAYNRLAEAFASQMYVSDSIDNIQSFYGSEIVNKGFLADQNFLNGLVSSILRIGNTETDMLRVLYTKALVPLFKYVYGTKPVFSMDFMEELTTRLANAKSEELAADIVAHALTDAVPDTLGYKTAGVRGKKLLEAFMLHHDSLNPTSESAKLWAKLEQDSEGSDVTRALYDTFSEDSATAIWFYELNKINLLS